MTQKNMIKMFGQILKNSQPYKKVGNVWIRDAVPGEVITTTTGDGKETTNTAKEGEKVVKNIEAGGEEYIISADKVSNRYDKVKDTAPDPWTVYKAKGFVNAFRINPEDFGFQDTFYFEAPWGESMKCNKGDYIATTWDPDTKEQSKVTEVYRIAAKEFKKTYVAVSS